MPSPCSAWCWRKAAVSSASATRSRRRADAMLAGDRDYQLLRDDPGRRPDQRADHPGRGRRSSTLRSSSAVSEVLRSRSVDPPVRRRSAGRPGSRSSATPGFAAPSGSPARSRPAAGQQLPDKFERYVARDRDNPDLRRKALAAIAAKMARTAHAIVKRGVDYRPFFEGAVPRREDPSLCRAVETRRDLVDNVRVFRLVLDLVLRTVRAAPRTLCLLWERPLP